MSAQTAETIPSSTSKLRLYVTLFGVAMAIFMGALENTVVGTAMPTVIASLGGIEIYSWVFAAYILASTVMTPIWGKTADLIGRRPAIFGGLSLFIIGSALSGASQSMEQLIVFRIIQGLGAAALFPIGMTIVADMLSLEQRTKMIGIFSGMWGVASLVGPIAGGYLTAYTRLSWRWCFYIILPFGILAAIMIGISYRERYARRENISIDYAGIVTLTSALVLLLLIVEQSAQLSLPKNLIALTVCGLLLAAFFRIEKTHADPLIPLSLFRNKTIAVATLHGFFAMMALIGTMSFLPLFVQAVIGTNAAEAGKVLIPFIIPWVLASIIGGRLIMRFGYRNLVIAGMTSMFIGSALLTRISSGTTLKGLALCTVFLGLGGGLTVVTLMIAAQHSADRKELGITTSTVQFSRSIGAALGTAIMGSLMTWRLGRLLANAPAEIASLAKHSEIGSIVTPESRKAMSPAATAFLQQALAGSLNWAFTFVFLAVIAGTVVAFFIPRGHIHHFEPHVVPHE